MPIGQRNPSITPRPTKASMLRSQKNPTLIEEPKVSPKASPKASPKTTTSKTAKPSEGVKAFMAQQRARAANQSKDQTEKEKPAVKSKVMTGAQRYGATTTTAQGPTTHRNLQVVIKQAKGSGRLDISSRDLKEIPEEVLKMYHVDPKTVVVDFSSSGDSWYDAEELGKFMAGDNQITHIDERFGKEFGSLKQIDFRVNKLSSLPESIELLQNLTSVLLPHNEFETIPSVLFKLDNLKELDMSHNRLCQISISDSTIERLDLSHNEIEEILIPNASTVKNLTKIDLGHNKMKRLPDAIMHASKLNDLQASQNKLEILFTGDVSLPTLMRLDVSNNQLTRMTTGSLNLPKLVEVSLQNNKMTEAGMMGLKGAPHIQTLDISSNKLKDIPVSALVHLVHLQRLDVRANDIHQVPYELGQLGELKTIHMEGNPMRITGSMAQFIESLRSKYSSQPKSGKNENMTTESEDVSQKIDTEEPKENLQANEQQVDLARKFVLSNKQLTELSAEDISFVDEAIPGGIILSHNMLTQVPLALSNISQFIVHLDLENNRLEEFNLTMDGLVFSSLKVLKLSNNRIKTLRATGESSFPKLEEFTLNRNFLTQLPDNLALLLPELKNLSLSSNKVDNINIDMFGKKLEILNLSNNEISHLPPELSTLELKELIVFGNR
ncbi:unnamed protein product [Rhizopus stolonifer]